jgi:hypothetical protein
MMLIAAIFTAHLLVVHGSIIAHWVFQPLHGLGYQLWSGIASDVGEVTLVGGTLALLKHANCDAPRCLRYGPHRTADGHHRLCRKHHPDMPNRRLSLKEIHERHHKAQIEREPVTSV